MRYTPLAAACLLLLLGAPLALDAQTTSGVPGGGTQYEQFTSSKVPAITWRGFNAARTRFEFYMFVGLDPHPEYRRHPMKLTFKVDTLEVTFDTRPFGENFFDPFMVPYIFEKPGKYEATLTEWYLMPNKEWEKVVRTQVIVPVRRLLQ